jgi:hypothetical protein
MKIKNIKFVLMITILLIFLFPFSYIHSQNVGETYRIDINNISLPINNSGVLADVNIQPLGQGGQFDGHVFLYSAGFFLSGYVDDSLWANGIATDHLIEDYIPGTVNILPSDPRAALYKLSINDPDFGVSWQDWIDAVELGANFYDGDGNGIYNPIDLNGNGIWDPDEDKPDLLGDLTLWCVYNDGKPANERRYETIEPLGIEIKQTVFAYETSEIPLSNVLFVRYKITNTGTIEENLESVVFGISYDPDIGGIDDDLGGTDILRNAHYSYNDSIDVVYGENAPALLVDFLSGPASYIPGVSFIDYNGNGTFEQGIDLPLDTAYTFHGPLGVIVSVGATNLKMMSGVFFPDGGVPPFGSPQTPQQARNYLFGLTIRGYVVDPCTFPYGEVRGGVNCSTVSPFYWYSGDPVSDIGWINTVPGENHAIFSLQSFNNISAGQTKEIVVAYIVGRGTDALNSVDIANALSDEIQDFYENNFGYPIVLNINDNSVNPNDYSLSQNYPNPFNPTTRISYQIPLAGFVTLKIYDVLGKEVAALVNEEKSAGSYEVVFKTVGLASGVYIYRLKVNEFISSKKMILLR